MAISTGQDNMLMGKPFSLSWYEQLTYVATSHLLNDKEITIFAKITQTKNKRKTLYFITLQMKLLLPHL